MPEYRVRAGVRFGAQSQYGPGDVVELTEQEAAGFADKLEPAGSVVSARASETRSINVSDKTVTELQEWIGGKPEARDVEMALGLEQAGKQRRSVINLFTAYLEEDQ